MDFRYIIYAVIGLVVVWAVWTYNRLVSLRYRVKEALADIDVQLKRRFDLIPNLLATVRGYMSYEQNVLQKVTEARSHVLSGKNPLERAGAENELSMTLRTLFAVAENYPDLKANANFLELQRELADTENKIQASRRFHNSAVLDLNSRVDSFPSNVVAKIFAFTKEKFFEVKTEHEREPVSVRF